MGYADSDGCESPAALRPAATDQGAPGPGAHPSPEPVDLATMATVGLIRALHGSSECCGHAAPEKSSEMRAGSVSGLLSGAPYCGTQETEVSGSLPLRQQHICSGVRLRVVRTPFGTGCLFVSYPVFSCVLVCYCVFRWSMTPVVVARLPLCYIRLLAPCLRPPPSRAHCATLFIKSLDSCVFFLINRC